MKNYPKLVCTAVVLLLFFSCGKSAKPLVLIGDHQQSPQWLRAGGADISDGVLTLCGEGASAVLAEGKFADFLFATEVMTTGGATGEIWFHTDQEISRGYAVALDNNPENPRWWRKTGSLVSVRNLTKTLVRDGEWFSVNIIVSGKYIRIEIDGRPVVEYIEPEEPFRTEANAAQLLSQGTFAVVNRSGGEIRFRNMSVLAAPADQKIFSNRPSVTHPADETTDDIIRLHQEDFPVLDYHVHLKGGLTKEQAAVRSRLTGINYAVAPNCGIGFTLTDDRQVSDYIDSMRTEPFILAMQAEGREWIETFSPEVRSRFDYVFTDALTFTDNKGRRTRLWIPEETWIDDDPQAYMDMIVDRICQVLEEPVDIYVNPCFLPSPMDERYDELWTDARIDRFVEALAASGKALEINELYRIPNKAIIDKAKQAGVKFTFGTNNVVPEVSMLEYGIRMKNECGLTAEDMYVPRVKL
ncbi:MAG: DUF1080 domain-containing protein [Rikenellaceae bacterium]|nr:DUF1080 domain-containing protein [Rikenellaceae bacterium]